MEVLPGVSQVTCRGDRGSTFSVFPFQVLVRLQSTWAQRAAVPPGVQFPVSLLQVSVPPAPPVLPALALTGCGLQSFPTWFQENPFALCGAGSGTGAWGPGDVLVHSFGLVCPLRARTADASWIPRRSQATPPRYGNVLIQVRGCSTWDLALTVQRRFRLTQPQAT